MTDGNRTLLGLLEVGRGPVVVRGLRLVLRMCCRTCRLVRLPWLGPTRESCVRYTSHTEEVEGILQREESAEARSLLMHRRRRGRTQSIHWRWCERLDSISKVHLVREDIYISYTTVSDLFEFLKVPKILIVRVIPRVVRT